MGSMANCVDSHSRALSQTRQNSKCIENEVQASLVVQWIMTRLPVQVTGSNPSPR